MAELEVVIPMTEYKVLKDFEAKYRKNEAKSKDMQDQLWQLEQ